jgi:hypothetical protein
MRSPDIVCQTVEKRAIKALAGIVLAGGLAATATNAAAQSKPAAVPGVVVEATVTPIRWLGLIPTQMVRFELTIYVDRRVGSFSAIQYECRFVAVDGSETGLASRGTAVRDAFTAVENGRLVSRAHEELPDRGQSEMRCRATILER